MMIRFDKATLVSLFILSTLFLLTNVAAVCAEPATPPEVPVKGMVTMVDLGAHSCIPCKMMVPIMENVDKKYKGKAAVIYIDVWKDQAPAKRFGVRAVPTQIFFDREGREFFRHEGFMSEPEIDKVFNEMGVS